MEPAKKSFALYNSKGGVGKSSVCVNLAWTAAHEGKKVLLWDLDPQGAASYYLSKDRGLKSKAKKLISGKSDWGDEILPTAWQNLKIIPADHDLKDFEILVDEEKRSKKLLGDWIRELFFKFDVIFLDCPPGISLVSENIFRAVEVVLVPVVPTPLSVRSLGQVDDYIGGGGNLKGRLWPFVSMADGRKKIHRELTIQIHELPQSLKTVVPLLSEIEKMGQTSLPSALREKSSSREIFHRLWEEISTIRESL